jgi:hypothetical protein
MRSPRSIANAVFLLAALPFMLGAGYLSYRTLWFKLAGERTQGTVVEVTRGTPSLVVEYLARNEELFTTTSAGSDLYRDIAVRDKLTVYYDPRNPSDARIDLFVENWVLALAVAFPGLLIVIAWLALRPG